MVRNFFRRLRSWLRFHSLRFRLLITMLAVIMFPVGAIAYLASHTTTAEFENYIAFADSSHEEQVNRVLVGLLRTFYSVNQSWDDAQSLLEQLGQVTDTRIVLLDQQGKIIADSKNTLIGQTISLRQIRQEAYIYVRYTPVGAVVVFGSPYLKNDIAVASQTSFIASINRFLIGTVIATGVVMLVLTLLLSKRISSPLEALTTAVRKMEKGDLNQRVVVRSKDEIGELGYAFNEMVANLAHNEMLRRNMVSDIAHELRTPLSCIIGYLEALQDGVTQYSPELVDSLYEEASLLQRLVADLQDLALADAGQLRLERQTIEVETVVEQAIIALRPQASQRELTLVMEVAPYLPYIYADSERIGQVLRNLLKNAIHYTAPEGQITVSAILSNTNSNEIIISVKDTGIGISPDHLPFVFERFYRIDPSRTHETGGAGLGLAIVKKLVESHGGRVWAESTFGQGAVFTFTLPVNKTSLPPENRIPRLGMNVIQN